MKKSCQNILKKVYDKFQRDSDSLYIPLDEDDMSPDSITLQNDINALLSDNYIKEDTPLSSGYILSMTEKGRNYVENDFQNKSLPQQSFNFQNATLSNPIIGSNATFNNSIIGNNASENDLNTGASFSELDSLIKGKPDNDQPELQELLRALEKIKESSEPVHPGILARFSDLVKKHTDLIVPIGRILVDIFFTAQ